MPNNVSQEITRQMGIKAALVSTTNTQGWQYVKQLADRVVKNAVQEALDEEQPSVGESKRLKAKALQKGFAELFQQIETVKQYNPSIADDSGLGGLEFDDTLDAELGN